MPEGLEDVSCFPAVFEELASRGYSDEDLMKIAGQNLLRVLGDAERAGTRLRAELPPSRVTIEEVDRD
jgi:membrane dipeptidase